MFTLAFAAYALALGVARSLATPLSIRHSTSDLATWRGATASAVGTVLTAAGAGGLLCLVAAAAAGSGLSSMLLVLALSLPGLLIQDVWRVAFVAARRPRAAFANDLAWGLAMFPAMAALAGAGVEDAEWYALVWGGSATLAAAVGALQARVLPRLRPPLAWWRRHRELVARYVVEFLAITGTAQLVLFGIGAAAGLAALGGVRAGMVLLGPLNILLFGAGLAALPELARLVRTAPRRLVAATLLLAGVLVAAAAGLGTTLLLLPESVGRSLVGEVWAPAREVLLPLTIHVAAVGTSVAAGTGLRAVADARSSLRAAISASPAILAGAVGGAAVAGAEGAAWGLACGQVTSACIWWRFLLRSVRRPRPEPGAEVSYATPPADRLG